jgi:hypothetical protein
MALRAANSDESRRGTIVVVARTVEVGSALDQLRPSGSMTWDTRESQSVCAVTPAGEAVARNGAFKQLRVLRFRAGDNNDV